MKKQVTEQQLLALSDRALARLIAWPHENSEGDPLPHCILWGARGRGRVVPQFTIGDMLEFLDACGITPTLLPGPVSAWCDVLWSLVVSQLERGDGL